MGGDTEERDKESNILWNDLQNTLNRKKNRKPKTYYYLSKLGRGGDTNIYVCLYTMLSNCVTLLNDNIIYNIYMCVYILKIQKTKA